VFRARLDALISRLRVGGRKKDVRTGHFIYLNEQDPTHAWSVSYMTQESCHAQVTRGSESLFLLLVNSNMMLTFPPHRMLLQELPAVQR
jgi:hypothetical protein